MTKKMFSSLYLITVDCHAGERRKGFSMKENPYMRAVGGITGGVLTSACVSV